MVQLYSTIHYHLNSTMQMWSTVNCLGVQQHIPVVAIHIYSVTERIVDSFKCMLHSVKNSAHYLKSALQWGFGSLFLPSQIGHKCTNICVQCIALGRGVQQAISAAMSVFMGPTCTLGTGWARLLDPLMVMIRILIRILTTICSVHQDI